MPAPTALQRADPEEIAQNLHDTPVVANNEDDEMLISTTDAPAVQAADQTEQDTAMTVDSQPLFAAEKTTNQQHRSESRKVPVPPHRWTPLKSSWPKIYPPLVEHLKLQVRVNVSHIWRNKHHTNTMKHPRGPSRVCSNRSRHYSASAHPVHGKSLWHTNLLRQMIREAEGFRRSADCPRDLDRIEMRFCQGL
ncbi:unnamed protein product [Aureobasidium pullulans]|nr:unnamed protein product [Aureobasidium pullulans]